MSTLQHINSVVNYNWPELSRKYPGFEKPQIVPAETLRGLAPIYLRSAIDQDPTSYFMFIAGDATKGDCSREKACEFFDELFYEKLQAPSSYDIDAGGDLPRDEAIDKEVLPPATDRQFRSFYDEQMAKVDAEEARKRRIEDLGFDPDDGNTIDVDVDADTGSAAETGSAVGQAQTTAVGMPKKIFYAVDFHCPANGMLGYDGNSGRLDGRRRPGGYLREAYGREAFQARLQPAVDKFAGADLEWLAKLFVGLVRVHSAESDFAFLKTVVSVAACGPAAGASASNAKLHEQFDLFILRDAAGKFTWVECDSKNGSVNRVWDKIDAARSRELAATYQLADCQSYGQAEIKPVVDAIGEALRAGRGFDGRFFSEEDGESDPEKMMKEFVEKKENGEIEEDDMLKNRPHNLHKANESKDEAEDAGDGDESESGDENESEDEFELNESMVRFCDRLIRG